MTVQCYRKRPVEIEAAQFVTDDDAAEIYSWVVDNGGRCVVPTRPTRILILTLEGEMRADQGDWVIRGVKGEFYPCKPDIFETTYERV